MRYFVTIGDRELDVELGPEGIRVDGEVVSAELMEMDGTDVHSLLLGGRSYRVLAARGGAEEWTLHMSGRQLRARVTDERTRAIREMTGVKAVKGGARSLRAPMPGLVVKVEAAEGDWADPGQGLVIVEAMKMENELKSDGGGRISRVLVRPGQIVEKDQILVEFEPPSADPEKGLDA